MLETSRLILKVATLQEAASMVILNSDPEVIRYTGDNPTPTIQDAETVIKERLLPQFEKYQMGRFSVYLKDATYIGWCGLRFFPEQDEVDLGYRLMKKYGGQGYATEASIACLAYGFKTLKLKRIVAKAMPENTTSIKVMQKLRMTFRGYHNDPTDPHGFMKYDISAEEFHQCKN
jgi:[ribosomal protein S5]-alanine N-acetyltransferase